MPRAASRVTSQVAASSIARRLCHCNRAVWRPRLRLRHLLSDERGSEIVQLALVLPILLGILWSAFEIRQITALRTRVRDTAAQVARYMTGFAAQPDIYQDPEALQAQEIYANLDLLVSNGLSGRYGTVEGHALTWDITWYRVNDPFDANWEGNHTAIANTPEEVLAFIASLACDRYPNAPGNNAQFALQLRVSVPWRTVLLGLGQISTRDFALELRELAMGAVPCKPYLILTVTTDPPEPVPGGCNVVVHWEFEASYAIERIEVWRGEERLARIMNPLNRGRCSVSVPTGTSTLMVQVMSGNHLVERELTIDCPAIQD
jgi:Flp pilus assembly protein TadG